MPQTMNRMQLPDHVFREYDIRGKAHQEIDERFAYLLGRAYGESLRQAGFDSAVVGRDNRKSSPALHQALISGFHQAFCRVIDIGEVTSPMFYYALEHLKVPNGIMITASHNPGDENGFKIAADYTTIYGEEIRRLYKIMSTILGSDGIPSKFLWKNDLLDVYPMTEPYLAMLGKKIQLGPAKRKVVVDCGNGTASIIAPEALRRWGLEVVELYCESDPDFPNHHPDPVDPANLTDLIEKVKSSGADLGIAFDGDGDRLGVVDEKGNILWGDRLMILFWREILQKYPGVEALVEVKCSKALSEEIAKLGGKPVFHRTGHSHIKATMRARQLLFAGEMSGHLFFRDEFFGFDDALYAAGRLLRILTHSDGSLSQLFADVPSYPATPETRVPMPEVERGELMRQLADRFRSRGCEVIDVDGVRAVFPGGWGLIRCSNTQPILVLRAEAESEAQLAQIKTEVEEALRAAGADVQIDW